MLAGVVFVVNEYILIKKRSVKLGWDCKLRLAMFNDMLVDAFRGGFLYTKVLGELFRHLFVNNPVDESQTRQSL